MSCCTTSGTGSFFSKSAGYYARKFRRRGIDRPQKILLRFLKERNLTSRSILEVGCGVGGLHLTLLKEGARSAFGSELSDRMIEKAKELAGEMGIRDRVDYMVGDIVEIRDSVPLSDIVILDKVVCCYHDPALLLSRAASKCTSLLAASYPRDAFLPRWGFRSQAFIGDMLRWSFHAMYHEPLMLDSIIASLGFQEVSADHTPIWQVKVYEKKKNN